MSIIKPLYILQNVSADLEHTTSSQKPRQFAECSKTQFHKGETEALSAGCFVIDKERNVEL